MIFLFIVIFQKFSQNKKEKKRKKIAATSPSNRSGRLCERFCESEESGRTILLSREEKQIQPKIKGGRKNFLLCFLEVLS
jgi:hypothetical protein